MDFSIKSGELEKMARGCIILPLHTDLKLTTSSILLNKITKNFIKDTIQESNFSGKTGSTLFVHKSIENWCDGVLFVGVGDKNKITRGTYTKVVDAIFQTLKNFNKTEATLISEDFKNDKFEIDWTLQTITKIFVEKTYKYTQTKKSQAKKDTLKRINYLIKNSEKIEIKESVLRGKAIGDGVNLARDLGNLPPNICTPTFLANKAKILNRLKNVNVRVLARKDLEGLGMGSLLSVSNGSYEPPQFIIINYSGGRKAQRPVVLIGKGITFDTGGISLKPSNAMDEMKYDMSGAGSVIGTMQSIARMKLPLNVVALVPASENMPGGGATRPSDVVTSMSGKTIEILNTDAEGRLILCDAITYASRFKPAAIVDVATLTGACVVALGSVVSGMFSNDDHLAVELEQAGHKAWDRVWRLPTWPEYHEQLESNFADMANIGGRAAGSVTAACFLEKFAEFPWAHLDIAGTAWVSGKAKGSTGRPVPLLCEFLMSRAGW